MNFYYMVITENRCSNIDNVIPSKYMGELSYKTTGLARRELFFHPSSNSTPAFKWTIAESILISHNRFEYFSSKKYTNKINYIYIYKDLKEYELSVLHLSIDSPKIFTYNEDDTQVLNLIKDYSQSYYEVMEHLNQIAFFEDGFNYDSERIDTYSNEIHQELIGQKANFPINLNSTEFTDQIDRVTANPKLLIRSKKLITIYKNWFNLNTKLRFN